MNGMVNIIKSQLSPYHVNKFGVLCYAGLPTGNPAKPIKFEHHNTEQYFPGVYPTGFEVYGVMIDHLLHGRPGRRFEYYYLR